MSIWNKEIVSRWRSHDTTAPAILARKGDDAELYLYQPIGMDTFGDSTTATQVVEHLKSCQGARSVTVHINSPGGEVFDGLAIYNELARFPAKKTVIVDGIAASIASVIAMAGDRIVMAPGSEMMIHNAHTVAVGDADKLRKVADRLEQANANIRGIYAARTRQTDESLCGLMDAETFMSADRAVELGFADCVEERRPMKNEEPTRLNRISDLELWKLRARTK